MDKERVSNDQERLDAAAPILPVVNPETEKPTPTKSAGQGIHAGFYIAYVATMSVNYHHKRNNRLTNFQHMDHHQR